MVQIFTEKYPELPALFLSYYGLWKTIDFLSDASSWASNVHYSWPKWFAWRYLNIWLIRLCASMISIEMQNRKDPFGHPAQPSALQNCSFSFPYNFDWLIQSSYKCFRQWIPPGNPLTTSDHCYYGMGLGLHPVTRREISMRYNRRTEEEAKGRLWTAYKEPVFQSKRPTT